MRVIIGVGQLCFVRRAVDDLAELLATELAAVGHEVDVVRLPFSLAPAERVLDSLTALSLLDLSENWLKEPECFVGLEFPAYLVKHPRKSIWLAHCHEWLGDEEGGAADAARLPPGVRRALSELDRAAARDVRRRFAVSAEVAWSFQRRTSLSATTLYPAPPSGDAYQWIRTGDFALVPEPLDPDRVALLSDAVTRVRAPLRVLVAGEAPPSATDARVSGRLRWLGRVTEEERRRLFGRCRFVLCLGRRSSLPRDSLHAMASSKALVVCCDGGADAELVAPDRTGWLVAPEPAALAASLDEAWLQPARARAYGIGARALLTRDLLDWPEIARRLLAGDPPNESALDRPAAA